MAKKKEGFEAKLEALTTISETLERGDLSLDEMLSAFEGGIKLYRECNELLENAEAKVKQIIDAENNLETDFLIEEV